MTISGNLLPSFCLPFSLPHIRRLLDQVRYLTQRTLYTLPCSLIPYPYIPSPCHHTHKKREPNVDLSNPLLLAIVNPLDDPHGRRRRKRPQADHLHRPQKPHPHFPPSLPPNNRPCLHPPKRKKTHNDHGDTAEERKEDARPVNAEVGD